MTRVEQVVVVYDVSCPSCSRVARELPELVRVPVVVRSCRDPQLTATFPTLRPAVAACAVPAIGVVRGSGRPRWWYGRTGALALLPLLRPRDLRDAVELFTTSFRARRF